MIWWFSVVIFFVQRSTYCGSKGAFIFSFLFFLREQRPTTDRIQRVRKYWEQYNYTVRWNILNLSRKVQQYPCFKRILVIVPIPVCQQLFGEEITELSEWCWIFKGSKGATTKMSYPKSIDKGQLYRNNKVIS